MSENTSIASTVRNLKNSFDITSIVCVAVTAGIIYKYLTTYGTVFCLTVQEVINYYKLVSHLVPDEYRLSVDQVKKLETPATRSIISYVLGKLAYYSEKRGEKRRFFIHLQHGIFTRYTNLQKLRERRKNEDIKKILEEAFKEEFTKLFQYIKQIVYT